MIVDRDRPGRHGLAGHAARAFGVRLVGDIHERACGWGLSLPLGFGRRRRLAMIADARILFIHIPRNGGMSASAALYGAQVGHATIRFYRTVAPRLVASLPSVAVLRDPVERFVSAYDYARSDGTCDNQVSLPFRAAYRAFRSIDEALDHVEAAAHPYGVDPIFRPQCWYVSDTRSQIAVDHLLLLDGMEPMLAALTDGAIAPLGHLNRQTEPRSTISDAQADRIRALYRRDMMLYDSSVLRARSRVGGAGLKPVGPDVITCV